MPGIYHCYFHNFVWDISLIFIDFEKKNFKSTIGWGVLVLRIQSAGPIDYNYLFVCI